MEDRFIWLVQIIYPGKDYPSAFAACASLEWAKSYAASVAAQPLVYVQTYLIPGGMDDTVLGTSQGGTRYYISKCRLLGPDHENDAR